MVSDDKEVLPEEAIVSMMRKEYDDWIKDLSSDEIKAIRKYTRNSSDNKPNRFFERMNALLRGDYYLR